MPEMDRLSLADAVNESCPSSGKPISADSLTLYRGLVVGFCNPGCRDRFAAAVEHFERAAAARGASPEPNDPPQAPGVTE